MATITTAIKVQDAMSPAFRSMNNALNIVLNSFEQVQSISGKAIDTASIHVARQELANANATIIKVEEQIKKTNNASDKMPQKFKNATNSADGLLNKVKNIALAIGGITAIKNTLDLSDKMTNTTARLNLIVDDGGSVEELQNKIFESAQRSRADYMTTAGTVAKLSMNAGNAFKDNDETIQFAELLNKQFVIAGSEQSEIASASLQLTQALGAGALRGEELNAVFEAAPPIIQNIADYLDVDIGKIKGMAAEGKISADIVKNAMFASADSINQKFESMPVTWGQLWTSMQNQALIAFQPVLEKINQLAQNQQFQQMINDIMFSVQELAGVIFTVVEFIANNWGIIEPILLGIVGAVTAWKAVTIAQTIAQWALNTAVWANPLTWVCVVIMLVVAAIVVWINKIGGLKVAWLTAVNYILFAWDVLHFGLKMTQSKILDIIENLQLMWKIACTNIANFIGDLKTNALLLLEGMCNGAIDIINQFIEKLRTIPGVSIETIDHVTFGTEAQIKNEAEKQARNSELQAKIDEVAQNRQARKAELQQMAVDAMNNYKDRLAEIERVKAENAEEKDITNSKNLSDNVSNIASNTGTISNKMDIAEEDLKYLRDIAERDAINRFTTAEIKIEMTNHNNINSDMDLDGIVSSLTDGVREAMEKSAEGVHA